MDDTAHIPTASDPPAHPHRRTFERVRDHLLRQGRRAVWFEMRWSPCQYRTVATDGTVLRCAIGCLIPEDRYDEMIEGATIESLTARLDPALGIDPSTDPHILDMLIRLQGIHDNGPPPSWPAQLTAMAQTFDADGRWPHSSTAASRTCHGGCDM